MIAPVLKLRQINTVRPHGTLLNPGRERRDLGCRQPPALGWHDFILVCGGDEVDQRAVLRFARENVRRVFVAAFQRRRFHIEPEARLLFFPAVTLVAVALKDRADLTHKVHRRSDGGSGGGE